MDLIVLGVSFLAIAALERVPRLARVPAPFLRAHFAADLAFLLTGAVALGLAVRFGAARLAAALGVPPLPEWPAAFTFALALLIYDFGAWLVHYVEHRVEPLWRVHKVHHASPRLDWLATFRMHPLEHLLRHLASPALLVLLGFPLAQVALASLVFGAWAALNHANLALGSRLAETLLVTPRLHHVHHVPATCDRNYGGLFSFWDRLAGCFAGAPAPRDAVLGVPGEEETYPHGWWPQVREPFSSHAPGPNRVGGRAARTITGSS